MALSLIDYLKLRPVGERLEDLETPVHIIDVDVVERNVTHWQNRCNLLGLANRPHINTHKLAGLAKYQIAKGAGGLSRSLVCSAAPSDMLLTDNNQKWT